MAPRVQKLFDALNDGPDRFEEVYGQLKITPRELKELLCEMTPGLTMQERCDKIEAAANHCFGHGFFNPH